MVENCLKELTHVVQDKINVLQSDKVELQRQLMEIKMMKEFIKAQTTESHPLEFLKMYSGYEHLKYHVCKADSLMSNIDTEITVNKSLQIKSTDFFKGLRDQTDRFKEQLLLNVETKIASTKNRQLLFGQLGYQKLHT